jgi:hypothetical protein
MSVRTYYSVLGLDWRDFVFEPNLKSDMLPAAASKDRMYNEARRVLMSDAKFLYDLVLSDHIIVKRKETPDLLRLSKVKVWKAVLHFFYNKFGDGIFDERVADFYNYIASGKPLSQQEILEFKEAESDEARSCLRYDETSTFAQAHFLLRYFIRRTKVIGEEVEKHGFSMF